MAAQQLRDVPHVPVSKCMTNPSGRYLSPLMWASRIFCGILVLVHDVVYYAGFHAIFVTELLEVRWITSGFVSKSVVFTWQIINRAYNFVLEPCCNALRQRKKIIPATTPRTSRSTASLSTNCRGVRYRTCENFTSNSLGVRFPQNGAQEERTRLRSHLATIGALFNNIHRDVTKYVVLRSSQTNIDSRNRIRYPKLGLNAR